MTQSTIEYWGQLVAILSTSVAVLAGILGLIRYFQESARDRKVRQEELSWRKTQFLIELANNFEKDERFQRVFKLLEYGVGLPNKSSLNKILATESSSLNLEEIELRYAIDRYLDFFDRLYQFVFETKSLDLSDVIGFSWYLNQIGDNSELKVFASRSGYQSVIKLSEEVIKKYG